MGEGGEEGGRGRGGEGLGRREASYPSEVHRIGRDHREAESFAGVEGVAFGEEGGGGERGNYLPSSRCALAEAILVVLYLILGLVFIFFRAYLDSDGNVRA